VLNEKKSFIGTSTISVCVLSFAVLDDAVFLGTIFSEPTLNAPDCFNDLDCVWRPDDRIVFNK